MSGFDDEEPVEGARHSNDDVWETPKLDPETAEDLVEPPLTRIRRRWVIGVAAAIGILFACSIAYAITHRVKVARAEKELKSRPYGKAEAQVPQSIRALEFATTPAKAKDDVNLTAAAAMPQMHPPVDEEAAYAADRAQAGYDPPNYASNPRNYAPAGHHPDDGKPDCKDDGEPPSILMPWPEHKGKAAVREDVAEAPSAPSLPSADSLQALNGLQAQAASIGASQALAALTGGQDDETRKEAFQHGAGIETLDGDSEDMAECELEAGTPVRGNVLVATNSDLPSGNTVTIQVSEAVYCGADHQHLALPQGSKFVGAVDQRVVYGQDRLQLCMKQLNRPSSRMHPTGERKQLGCLVVADITGAAGMVADVDNHWGAVIAGGILSAVLSIGASSSFGNQEGFAPTIGQNAAHSAGASVSRAGDRIVQRDLNRKPTLKTEMLEGVTVMFTSNVPLEPWQPRTRSQGH